MYAKQTLGNISKNAMKGVNNVKDGMAMDERAVSPVIGVILMVAITVIMATVIGSFVFGMSGDLDTPRLVGVTATQINSTHIAATFVGGPDADSVAMLTATVNGVAYSGVAIPDLVAGETVVPVGAVMECTGATPGSDHVIVIATFLDGDAQVVLDTHV